VVSAGVVYTHHVRVDPHGVIQEIASEDQVSVVVLLYSRESDEAVNERVGSGMTEIVIFFVDAPPIPIQEIV
jgi:hypothetical protein